MKDVAITIESIVRDYCEQILWQKLEENGIEPELICFSLHYDSEEYDVEGEIEF